MRAPKQITGDGLIAVNLTKSFKGRAVIRSVTIGVERGEIVGLLGPNGAGKTTAFSMIMGLLKPNSGQIFLKKRNITNLPVFQRGRLGVGYLPQEASIFRGLTVAANIMAILELHMPNGKKRRQRLGELLDEFSIRHLANTNAMALSGGERRRVEIARALAANPQFMLLDEPFAGVDPIAVNDIQKLITYLAQKGIGILITDHNVRETLTLVQRAYIIAEGKVLARGSPQEIIQNPEARRAYLGEDFKI